MADTEYQRLIQASRERALFGFLAALQRAIPDAERAVLERQRTATGAERPALAAARHLLQQDSARLLRRADALYRSYLERAVKTMYIDLRPGMRKLSADELSLIDDEVVSQQIEVGRLAQRLREANEETIGRLNVIVGQLHGELEARERENPFRPYLPARALYEAVRETAGDETGAGLLFDCLSQALVQHLPAFYQSLRETFEAFGVQGKYVAQRSRNPHNPRHPGLQYGEAVAASLMPGLQRMLAGLQAPQGAMPAGAAAGAGAAAQPADIQDFIRRMFSAPPRASGPAGTARPAPPPVNTLLAELRRFQKLSAAAPAGAAGVGELAGLRAQLSLDRASVMERMTLDVVAMLFDFIKDDDKIPAAQRQLIGRLQIPLLRAAMLEPELLNDDKHPARRLFNRLSTAAVGCETASEGGRALAAAIGSAVQRVLDDFDDDSEVFASAMREFDAFLASQFKHVEGPASSATEAVAAVEAAERFGILLTRTSSLLCEVLLPLNADKRISDFIVRAWPHVLVHACWQDSEAGRAGAQPDSLVRQCRDVLPELVWSVQDKQDPLERSALIRMLPDLVKRLRNGLALIRMDEAESRAILDLLVEIHTQVLRGAVKAASGQQMTLAELRRQFAPVVVDWEHAVWDQAEPPQPRSALIEEVFARGGIAAELHLDAGGAPASRAECAFLAQAWLLGTRVSFYLPGGQSRPGQLIWISSHRSLYLFRKEGEGGLVLHTCASLLAALREETLAPLEYAPVFERAVESLLYGAGQPTQPA